MGLPFLSLWNSSGASGEPSWAFRGPLGRPGTPTTLKKHVFKVLAHAAFRYFEGLDGSLGPILAPLGPIWSQHGCLNGPRCCPKVIKKGSKNGSTNKPQKYYLFVNFGLQTFLVKGTHVAQEITMVLFNVDFIMVCAALLGLGPHQDSYQQYLKNICSVRKP